MAAPNSRALLLLALTLSHCYKTRPQHTVTLQVAPETVSNAEFTRTLASALHRPAIIPMPGFVLNILMGAERAVVLLEGSVRDHRCIEAKKGVKGARCSVPGSNPTSDLDVPSGHGQRQHWTLDSRSIMQRFTVPLTTLLLND